MIPGAASRGATGAASHVDNGRRGAGVKHPAAPDISRAAE